MRALHYSALALIAAFAVGGCSRQPPLQAAAPCVDLAGAPCAVRPDVAPPGPSLGGREAGTHRHKSVAAARHKRAHHHAEAHHKVTAHQPLVSDAAPAVKEPAAKEPTIPLAKWSAGAPAKQPETAAAPAPASSTGNASVQEQVAVATALAERITALSALPAHVKPEAAARSESAAAPTSSRLVAVLMVRPNVRAVSELRGRIIAMDERYAAASSKVTAAMAAAGASDVQLMQGQGTAINRLTNGEVPAAVVALVAPEAAEAFPEIAGYKIIRVPL